MCSELLTYLEGWPEYQIFFMALWIFTDLNDHLDQSPQGPSWPWAEKLDPCICGVPAVAQSNTNQWKKSSL